MERKWDDVGVLDSDFELIDWDVLIEKRVRELAKSAEQVKVSPVK